ncbi:Polycomb protein sop-2, partial [Nowakowskiella sp. JEL0078]
MQRATNEERVLMRHLRLTVHYEVIEKQMLFVNIQNLSHPMSAPEVFQLLHGIPIVCHAFNKDKSTISPNTSEVQIYVKQGSSWELEHTLAQHDKPVTSLDWAPNTNQIVSCSQDRNAYVWQWDTESRVWKPTMVLLRINRAATCVKWSPKENKFAVASGSKLIAVCYFDNDEMIQSWVSKHIKKYITSTVLSIDWHPDGILLAAGGADMKTRVFSAWIKGIDPKVSSPVWAEKLPFEHLCKEFSTGKGGWVHSVAFSPSGDSVAWTGHGSNVSIASPAEDRVFSVSTKLLPFTSLSFLSETSIVAVGHDCAPFLFQRNGDSWELVEKIDHGVKKTVNSNSAMSKFRLLDSRAQAGSGDAELNSHHQNTILAVLPYEIQSGDVTSFSTVGVDGKLIIWR